MTPAELKARRESLGLSQSQLATELGVHRQTVSQWERGVVPIPGMADLALSHLKCRGTWRERMARYRATERS